MTASDIHIGQLIEKRLNRVGMTKSEFSRRINKARQNINDILNRKSVDTDLLVKISEALDYDFFQHYTCAPQVQENPYPYRVKDSDEESSYIPPKKLREELGACKEQLREAKKEIQYLKKINALLEESLEFERRRTRASKP